MQVCFFQSCKDVSIRVQLPDGSAVGWPARVVIVGYAQGIEARLSQTGSASRSLESMDWAALHNDRHSFVSPASLSNFTCHMASLHIQVCQ